MDKELQELEAELQRLRPRLPSRDLTAAIARDLGAPGPHAANCAEGSSAG